MPNEKFYKDIEKAVKLANKHRQELLRYPGVVAVGAGPQRKNGELTGKAAIVVSVRQKLDGDDLSKCGNNPLPKKIDDMPVDVIEYGKTQLSKKITKKIEKAKSVLEQHKESWLKTKNITGMGIGFKKVNNEITDKLAVRFYVEKKYRTNTEVRDANLELIPKEIDGIETDVIQMPRLKPIASPSGSRADVHNPIVGGISIGVGNRPFYRGTLGAIAFDNATNEQLILSNEHVLDGAIGENVIQPAPVGLDDSIEVGFQLDICNPLHFFRLDTPNTPIGTALAAGAAAAALAAALSDEIDPTRRGQLATSPAAGAKTISESHHVKMSYPELPLPGVPFKVETSWKYTRHTDMGDLEHSVSEVNKNPHILDCKYLFTDNKKYHPGDIITLYAIICPNKEWAEMLLKPLKEYYSSLGHDNIGSLTHVPSMSTHNPMQGFSICRKFHPVAFLTPVNVDKMYPVVLHRVDMNDFDNIVNILLERLKECDDDRYKHILKMIRTACLYKGDIKVTNLPTGPWKHYLHVQTVNDTPDGLPPHLAAQTIGGLPISQNAKPNLDVGCGPFIFEDGEFDIELI